MEAVSQQDKGALTRSCAQVSRAFRAAWRGCGFRFYVLARETGEEGTQSQGDWGGEGIQVEVPSSIPSCFAGRAPFFSCFAGEDEVVCI